MDWWSSPNNSRTGHTIITNPTCHHGPYTTGDISSKKVRPKNGEGGGGQQDQHGSQVSATCGAVEGLPRGKPNNQAVKLGFTMWLSRLLSKNLRCEKQKFWWVLLPLSHMSIYVLVKSEPWSLGNSQNRRIVMITAKSHIYIHNIT